MLKRWYWWLIGSVLVTAMYLSATSRANSYCPGTYAPGIILVGFHDDISAVEQQADLNVTMTIPGIGASALRVPSGQECAALETLRRDSRIAFAELDYAMQATGTRILVPNDPEWAQQWGPAKIGAPVAWDVTTGTSDIVIAILDSGIRLNHQDLNDNLWTNPGEIPSNGIDDDDNGKTDDFWGWHFYHECIWEGYPVCLPGENNQVADDHGHGTHVAGIAGAETNNGVGIAGIAGGSRLMPVKVLDQYGDGWYSDLVQGIVYAVDNGAQIISLSLGGTPSSQALQEAVNYAHDRGVLVMAATGNDGGTVLYPAACEHVLGVAATDQNDSRASFSNHGQQVDVAAPGKDIYSTWYTYNYFTQSGTSMATPHTSGLAALIWSARPDLSAEQVTHIITTTAADVNGGTFPSWDEYLGWGRIEAGRALSATIHAGNLHLTASHPQLRVGETTVVTATVSTTDITANLFVFAASGGIVSPEMVALSGGVATTTLTAGPANGMAVLTGTTGSLSSTLFLRLLPGPVVSATLTPTTWEMIPGHSVSITLTAVDEFGNPPLDGDPIYWQTNGGTITPPRSSFHEAIGWTTLAASPTYGPVVITASLRTGFTTAITIDVLSFYRHYLPVILRGAVELQST